MIIYTIIISPCIYCKDQMQSDYKFEDKLFIKYNFNNLKYTKKIRLIIYYKNKKKQLIKKPTQEECLLFEIR